KEDQSAKHYIQMTLRNPVIPVYPSMIVKVLPAAAIVLAREGEREQAVELLALVVTPPSSVIGWLEKWPLMAQMRAELEADLSPEVFVAAWERGKIRLLAEVVRDLLERWQPAEEELHSKETLIFNRSVTEPLSDRELEVLHLIAAGASNQEIADQLVIGMSTVKKHINHIFDKLGVKSRAQALVRSRTLNLL
ncbi:MAG: LuxR C-terminal-related transcriptional regulator, partial [Chloroflexota bacterium]